MLVVIDFNSSAAWEAAFDFDVAIAFDFNASWSSGAWLDSVEGVDIVVPASAGAGLDFLPCVGGCLLESLWSDGEGDGASVAGELGLGDAPGDDADAALRDGSLHVGIGRVGASCSVFTENEVADALAAAVDEQIVDRAEFLSAFTADGGADQFAGSVKAGVRGILPTWPVARSRGDGIFAGLELALLC